MIRAPEIEAETIRQLELWFGATPVLLGVGGPVSREEIERAERNIGIAFSAGYREFLERYGGAMIGSLPLFGLRESSPVSTTRCSHGMASAEER